MQRIVSSRRFVAKPLCRTVPLAPQRGGVVDLKNFSRRFGKVQTLNTLNTL
jgi:hypothetical protein